MTDEDVIKSVSKLVGVNCVGRNNFGKLRTYRIYIGGWEAVGWMLTVYSLMHSRRKQKIIDIVKFFSGRKIWCDPLHCPNGHLRNNDNTRYDKSGRILYCRICHNKACLSGCYRNRLEVT